MGRCNRGGGQPGERDGRVASAQGDGHDDSARRDDRADLPEARSQAALEVLALAPSRAQTLHTCGTASAGIIDTLLEAS